MDFIVSVVLVSVAVWACWHWFLGSWFESSGIKGFISGRRAAQQISDEAYYEQVSVELRSGQIREGIWAQALAQADGNESRAQAIYMKLRVAAMKDEVARRFADGGSEQSGTSESVVVDCPKCNGKLRLPGGKLLDAKCPKCEYRFRVDTTRDMKGLDSPEIDGHWIGRIGRLAFLGWIAVQFAVGIILTVLINEKALQPNLAVSIFFIVAAVVFSQTVFIARLRDANKPEWISFTGLIPYVNLLLIFYLLVVPGSKGINRNGPARTGLFRNL